MDLYQPISKAATILSQRSTRARNPTLPIHGHEAHQSLLGRESEVGHAPTGTKPRQFQYQRLQVGQRGPDI